MVSLLLSHSISLVRPLSKRVVMLTIFLGFLKQGNILITIGCTSHDFAIFLIRSFEAKEFKVGEKTYFNLSFEEAYDESGDPEVFNPFVDWIKFNKSFPEKFKVFVTNLRDCFDDLISRRAGTETLAHPRFYDSISSACAVYLGTIQDHDEEDFKEGGYELFDRMVNQAHKICELRNHKSNFDNLKDYETALAIIVDLEEFMSQFQGDYETHSIWIFMNFYRSYNPFFYRKSGGEYVVRDFELFDECFNDRSLALYFMVCSYMLVRAQTNICLYVR